MVVQFIGLDTNPAGGAKQKTQRPNFQYIFISIQKESRWNLNATAQISLWTEITDKLKEKGVPPASDNQKSLWKAQQTPQVLCHLQLLPV